jgi:uncharacterized protein
MAKSKSAKPVVQEQASEISVEEKLRAMFNLQTVDSEVDKIYRLRGELPLEVQDLEDEIVGLQTRLQNLEDEMKQVENAVASKKQEIKDAEGLIKKYESQQNNVRNNREYDSLSKEIEFQNLEIQLCEKRIKEFNVQIHEKKIIIDSSKAVLNERLSDLNVKKSELEEISSETKKEEEMLKNRSREIESIIEPRLLTAYKRIRSNARNGLAVVIVERDACGGCFNKIPPQRQLEIRSRKKIIVCEYCGRILVDNQISNKKQPVEA